MFDEFGPAVHASALQILGNPAAQDVVQDVFVELWCNPQRYDESLGTLRTYLTLCARHRALDVLRGELRRAGREERHARLLPTPRAAVPRRGGRRRRGGLRRAGGGAHACRRISAGRSNWRTSAD